MNFSFAPPSAQLRFSSRTLSAVRFCLFPLLKNSLRSVRLRARARAHRVNEKVKILLSIQATRRV